MDLNILNAGHLVLSRFWSLVGSGHDVGSGHGDGGSGGGGGGSGGEGALLYYL